MTPEIKRQVLQLVKEYGTGRDTLRCLGLGTIDNPLKPASMDLTDSSKFALYEVGGSIDSAVFEACRSVDYYKLNYSTS